MESTRKVSVTTDRLAQAIVNAAKAGADPASAATEIDQALKAFANAVILSTRDPSPPKDEPTAN